MKLKVALPTKILLEEKVKKVKAEGVDGNFELLPRHVDYLSALKPGIIEFETKEGEIGYIAVNEGILIKIGSRVLVSTENAAVGTELGHLEEKIREDYLKIDDQEKKANTAVYNIESEILKKFGRLEKYE
ncbi:MAG: F0F1 ATP synthase subunit epsilon [Vulcanimicrobiota bacterium]